MSARTQQPGRPIQSSITKRHGWRAHLPRLTILTLALVAGLAFSLFAFVPSAAAHALPVKTNPSPRELVQAPPPRVVIQFSENVNPEVASIRVLDQARRPVDSNDTQVDPTDAHIVSVSLPLLKSGTYTVVWRVQSADDGHVSSGSYYFQIARADGSAPPAPTTDATGAVDDASSAILDGPSLFQAIATWIALALLTVWVGGLIWETWILNPATTRDSDLATATQAAVRRFRALIPTVLGLLVLANVAVVVAQAAASAGDWSGAISPTYLRAILFGSRYGAFWWMRQIVALVALYLTYAATSRGWASARAAQDSALAQEDMAVDAIPDWRRELVATLRGIGKLPGRLIQGWRARSWFGQIELLLAALLILAFALSGHAAAVSADRFAFAFSVDLLHLLANCAWLGGLFYISLVFVPALGQRAQRSRARALALGLPAFGAVAILSAILLAATGSLNATVRMTSFNQLVTTAYGRTLVIKILLFLLMAGISAYHAFVLRPRLASALTTEQNAPPQTIPAGVTLASYGVPAQTPISQESVAAGGGGDDAIPGGARKLAGRLEDWLRREAILGLGVLLCAALLGAFAGSLATAPTPIAGASSGAYVNTATTTPNGDYAVTLKVAPAKFGTNSFLATVKDKSGKPVEGASVLLQTTMLDMDMGTQSLQLTPVGADSPGTYGGQADLDMGGNWSFVIKVLPVGGKDFEAATYKVVVGYS
ncbi:MAG TPA: copper resistance protein CopC [Ktedonobacterales bacterium]|jgi:copper transport protein|nr:copper resistance protein CopC [Ktedonobacterales bacterium]